MTPASLSSFSKPKAASPEEIREGILATLAFFDLFNCPVTQDDAYKFLGIKCDAARFRLSLITLVNEGFVIRAGEHFSLKKNPQAQKENSPGYPRALRRAPADALSFRLIFQVPYVRAIAIPGRLSPKPADQATGIDLFIITRKNRLWITKTLLTFLFRAGRMFGGKTNFRLNHLVDESALEASEKDRYTATEICTLKPLRGDVHFSRFFTANAWTREVLPNTTILSLIADKRRNYVKRMLELVLNNPVGDLIDVLLFHRTRRRLGSFGRGTPHSHGKADFEFTVCRHSFRCRAAGFKESVLARHEILAKERVENYRAALF